MEEDSTLDSVLTVAAVAAARAFYTPTEAEARKVSATKVAAGGMAGARAAIAAARTTDTTEVTVPLLNLAAETAARIMSQTTGVAETKAARLIQANARGYLARVEVRRGKASAMRREKVLVWDFMEIVVRSWEYAKELAKEKLLNLFM